MRSDISRTNQFKYILEMNSDEFWESLKLLAIAVDLIIAADSSKLILALHGETTLNLLIILLFKFFKNP